MAITYFEASKRLIGMTQDLIDQYHPYLRNVRIGLIFRSEAAVSGGRLVYGAVKLVGAQMKAFIDYEVLIWIETHAFQGWNENRVRGLIDHQLCHIRLDENDRAFLCGHEIEEFSEVIARWGLWDSDTKVFGDRLKQSFEQLPLETVEPRGFVTAAKIDPAGGILEAAQDDPDAVAAELLAEARKLAEENGGTITISILQRKLRIGYTRAAKIRDLLEIVGAPVGEDEEER